MSNPRDFAGPGRHRSSAALRRLCYEIVVEHYGLPRFRAAISVLAALASRGRTTDYAELNDTELRLVIRLVMTTPTPALNRSGSKVNGLRAPPLPELLARGAAERQRTHNPQPINWEGCVARLSKEVDDWRAKNSPGSNQP